MLGDSVLITGICGFLAQHLAERLCSAYKIIGTCRLHCTVPDGVQALHLDLCEASKIGDLVQRVHPSLIIHAAALSRPDECELHAELARQVNVVATEAVARAAKKVGASLIYISTDMVFDGQRGFYREEDSPSPCNVYGLTKLQGEQVVISTGGDSVIVRLSLMYGRGNKFHGSISDMILTELAVGRKLALFVDEYRTPLSVDDAAEGIRRIATQGRSGGIFHLGGPERLSRYEFGRRLATAFDFPCELIEAIPLSEGAGPAKRGRDCSLNSTKACQVLGFQPGPLHARLGRLGLKKAME